VGKTADEVFLEGFWEDYKADVDMDQQLLALIARARKHGYTVGELRGRDKEQDRIFDYHKTLATIVRRFISGYGYRGWWYERLPKSFVLLVEAAGDADTTTWGPG
jgi:hypothetical protein